MQERVADGCPFPPWQAKRRDGPVVVHPVECLEQFSFHWDCTWSHTFPKDASELPGDEVMRLERAILLGAMSSDVWAHLMQDLTPLFVPLRDAVAVLDSETKRRTTIVILGDRKEHVDFLLREVLGLAVDEKGGAGAGGLSVITAPRYARFVVTEAAFEFRLARCPLHEEGPGKWNCLPARVAPLRARFGAALRAHFARRASSLGQGEDAGGGKPILLYARRRPEDNNQGGRNLTNAADTEAMLRRCAEHFGMELVFFCHSDFATLEERLALFWKASVVVGVHGGALYHAMACSPGALFVEVVVPDSFTVELILPNLSGVAYRQIAAHSGGHCKWDARVEFPVGEVERAIWNHLTWKATGGRLAPAHLLCCD